MRKVIAYILRPWGDEAYDIHPTIKIFPPFLCEVFAYIAGALLIYEIGATVMNHLNY